MRLKHGFKSILPLLCLCYSLSLHAQNPFGQIVTIETHFSKMFGNPSWLLIVRDVDSGQVSPYVFDFYSTDNFWMALSYGHVYRITVSKLTFGPFAEINNFCCLENGILLNSSIKVSLTGMLSPMREGIHCHVTKWSTPYFVTAVPG